MQAYMLSYTYIINKNKNMNELNLKPSVDAKDSGAKKKIYIAVGVLAAVAIVAGAVFITPSEGTQGFIRSGNTRQINTRPVSNNIQVMPAPITYIPIVEETPKLTVDQVVYNSFPGTDFHVKNIGGNISKDVWNQIQVMAFDQDGDITLEKTKLCSILDNLGCDKVIKQNDGEWYSIDMMGWNKTTKIQLIYKDQYLYNGPGQYVKNK